MSKLLSMMMSSSGGGGEPNPPSNVVFTQAGFDYGIGIGASSSSYRMYYKSTNDLAYGGYYYFVGGTGNRWCIALYVSETLSGVQALIEDSNGSYSVSMSVASQPISYLGKTWYYTTTDSAVASDQSHGYINGKYLIGEGQIYEGNDRIINAVKDLLDYVYSF